MPEVKSLAPEQLYTACNTDEFSFRTTDELPDLDQPLGQQRASDAIRFGIGIRRSGYNLFALGSPGAGRRELVRSYIEKRAAGEPTPPDRVYVNNFQDPQKPWAIELPAGRGVQLRDQMMQLMDDLRAAIPAAFESEEYRARRKELEDSLTQEQGEHFEELGGRAEKEHIALIRTPRGMAFAPMKESGEVYSPEDFQKLPEKEQEVFQEKIQRYEEELEEILHQVPKWQRRAQKSIRELDRDVARVAVNNLIDDVHHLYEDVPEAQRYLESVKQDVLDNTDDFHAGDEDEGKNLFALIQGRGRPSLRRFQVNVLVDNSGLKGAPVVFENNPNHNNLMGRIEHVSQMGALITDFTLIRAGSLHRANRGYLILDARKLLTQPFAWEGLKRALFSGEVRVESLGQELSLVSTVSLEPEPVPLDVKIVLLGERLLYYLLSQYDPEFGQLFKVAADFEETMPRDVEGQQLYARMIATLARREQLLPLDRAAVARVIEQGARHAEDAERLAIRVQGITDLLREADYFARDDKREQIERADVAKAVAQRRYRAGRVPERLQEAIQRGIILIATEGERVGQVNGLSVSSLGDAMFGHPVRITARVRLGKGEVVDIQREVDMAGPIYSKGMMIMEGYLGARYAPDFPLLLSASLVFEQTYGSVDGDSATAAELFALLSALADVPVRQSLAVTGSANQHGDVQAIGGVNEKIEGFFDTCAERGLTGDQGVLIPQANVKHLMLREDVVQAVRERRFHVYPFATVDEGLAIITGGTAGDRDDNGDFPQGSINGLVRERLVRMAEEARAWSNGDKQGDPS